MKTKKLTGDKHCPVDMMDTHVNCGTPMCHGGYYAIVNNMHDFSTGAKLLANDLGFADHYALMEWAGNNPDLWGNAAGDSMFSSSTAFGGMEYLDKKGLHGIIDHWKGVKKRLEALQ